MQGYSLHLNVADLEKLPQHIKRFRLAYITIKRITAVDRHVIFEIRCSGLVNAMISKLHFQHILTVDALLSDVLIPHCCPDERKLGFIYFASCSTMANGNFCTRRLARKSKGHPLVTKGGRVSQSTTSYDQPFMNDLHERILRDEVSLSTGIEFFKKIQHIMHPDEFCILVAGCNEVLKGSYNALCGRYSPSEKGKAGTFMCVGEVTMVVISTVPGKTLISINELNVIEQKILKHSDDIVNEG